MADVVAFFGLIFAPNSITKKNFFSNKLIFLKHAIFEKSKKIHSDSPKYCANFKYIINMNFFCNVMRVESRSPIDGIERNFH